MLNSETYKDIPHLSLSQITVLTGRIHGRAMSRPTNKAAAVKRLASAIFSRVPQSTAEKFMEELSKVGHFPGAESIINRFLAATDVPPATPSRLNGNGVDHSEEEEDNMAKSVAKSAVPAAAKRGKATPQIPPMKGMAPLGKVAAKVTEDVRNGTAAERGRKSNFHGKKIYAKVSENLRRTNSHGYRSMQIILNAKPGLSVEEFLAKGGRMEDLRWDAKHGAVEVRD